MPIPLKSVYIVAGEMNMVVTAMRKGNRWASSHIHQEEEQDGLFRNFSNLKETLNNITNLSDMEPSAFLTPFLDVIRSEDTTGPVTGLALSSVNKFLTYGLVDPNCDGAVSAVESIADAVTHARFVGTDAASDEVVLMKILQVLRTLLLTPVGVLLTNESVCEIMQSCFRICFEMRLSELLRKSAELTLMDMVQLLFCRLPQFSDDNRYTTIKKLKMRAGGMDTSRNTKKKNASRLKHKKPPLQSPKYEEALPATTPTSLPSSTSPVHFNQSQSEPIEIGSARRGSVDSGKRPEEENCPEKSDTSGHFTNELAGSVESDSGVASLESSEINNLNYSNKVDFHQIGNSSEAKSGDMYDGFSDVGSVTADVADDADSVVSGADVAENVRESDYVNPRGVRFTPQQEAQEGPLIPYGLPSVRELFRFLISLINPLDRHNTEVMIQIGLSLLTVALESGADHIGKLNCLMVLVKDDLCRYLFGLLSSERMSVFAATLRICFLLFESLRNHLKFQLELYLTRLMELVVPESSKLSYEQREIALDSLVQLWRIPGFVTELYLNYDCDLYCSNLFEDLIRLLYKNAFPMPGLHSTHLLSLDALLTVIESIEAHCHSRILSETQVPKGHGHESLPVARCNVQKAEQILPLSSSGYLLGQQILQENSGAEISASSSTFNTVSLPTREELLQTKLEKKLYATGTEKFNQKPSCGISFLQEHKLLRQPLNPEEVAAFLRNNPRLEKKMIGEYISNRKNLKVLEAFVKSFNFEDTRIDEALRTYLETFRLPGEAPLISLLMEHFAEHWHKSNGEPFANSDAAFTLSYAIIMLNVDQHNHNVKKQNNPMTVEEFKKNLKDVNGGQDFDEEMLEEIYMSIKNEEIVMPAEQTGLVRENYLWKVLLRRGAGREGTFLHASDGFLDHELFGIIWGPTVAALSSVFDKSIDSTIIHKAVAGFRKCAMISAYYGMSDVFDNLVISLCKFTIILSSTETPESLPVSFGSNAKAQLAAKTVFNLAHRHGDILREGWKNLLDCVLQLFHAKLLPSEMVEAEDFVNPNGYISLVREKLPNLPRTESGLFSSFYSYITLAPDPQNQKGVSPEDEEAKQAALKCISECHPEQLIAESKFLRLDSLQELVKALIYASHGPDSHSSLNENSGYDEDSTIFLLELLLKIVLQNRDRVLTIWPGVRDHLYSLVMGASACDHQFLLERSVVGILRLAIRMLRREETASEALQCVRMLLILKPVTLQQVSLHVSCALFELLRTNAANIRSSQDWSSVFSLMECVGAGAKPPRILNTLLPGWVEENSDSGLDTGAQSDSELTIGHHDGVRVGKDRGYTSDSELYEPQPSANSPRHGIQKSNQNPEGNLTDSWITVGKEGSFENCNTPGQLTNQYSIVLNPVLQPHNPLAYMKCCETLAFLVRDVAYITSENFESCTHCVRTFTEASMQGSCSSMRKTKNREKRMTKTVSKKRDDQFRRSYSNPSPNSKNRGQNTGEDEKEDEYPPGYHEIVIQLLDLMHTLHTRASSIYQRSTSKSSPTTEEIKTGEQRDEDSAKDSMWTNCWCPLLQGIAYSCCDARRAVRTSALTYLQRALLVHDLQVLTAAQWESCFNKVLFPLLSKLLEDVNLQDPVGVEETRMRAATLLCKVFLQHLNPLLTLPTFTALWLTILDFMDKYMHADGSDLLNEAIPESLKNMLLVMDTAGIFSRPDDSSTPSECVLWNITWDRINTFLPQLQEDVFKPPPVSIPASLPTSVLSDVHSAAEKIQSEAVEESFARSTSDVIVSASPSSSTLEYTASSRQTGAQRKDSLEERIRSPSLVIPSSQILTTPTMDLPIAPNVILHPPVMPVPKTMAYPFQASSPPSHCSVMFSVHSSHSSTETTYSLASDIKNSSVNPVPLLLNPLVVGSAPLNINQGVIEVPKEISCNPPS